MSVVPCTLRVCSTQEGKAVVGGLVQPPPPRCRDGVDSPYLPACGFPAPGDPRFIASREELLPRLAHGGLSKAQHCQQAKFLLKRSVSQSVVI